MLPAPPRAPACALVASRWGWRDKAEEVEHLDETSVVAFEAILVHFGTLLSAAVPDP